MDLKKYSALLFDCDGTIADSMPVHLLAWNRALAVWGLTISAVEHDQWAGRPTSVIVGLLNQKYGSKMDAEMVSRDKEKFYLDLMSSVKSIKPVEQVIRDEHGRRPMAVVSGSPRESVLKTLRHLSLEDKFAVVLGAGDYPHGKPAPDCFLAAAKVLGVDPKHCLVFEDADLGVEAARAAGMDYVRVGSEGFILDRSKF